MFAADTTVAVTNAIVMDNGSQSNAVLASGTAVTGQGGTIGQFTSTNANIAAVLKMSSFGAITPQAPNGYYCSARDLTTPATSVTVGSVTNIGVTLTGATAAGDTIQFECSPY